MQKQKIEIERAEGDFKPTPNAQLTEKKGNFILGTLKRKVPSTLYKDQLSYILTVEDLEGSTTLYDKATSVRKEVGIGAGEDVFVAGTTHLNRLMKQVNEGERIQIDYLGKGQPKKGQKAPHLWDVSRIVD